MKISFYEAVSAYTDDVINTYFKKKIDAMEVADVAMLIPIRKVMTRDNTYEDDFGLITDLIVDRKYKRKFTGDNIDKVIYDRIEGEMRIEWVHPSRNAFGKDIPITITYVKKGNKFRLYGYE